MELWFEVADGLVTGYPCLRHQRKWIVSAFPLHVQKQPLEPSISWDDGEIILHWMLKVWSAWLARGTEKRGGSMRTIL